ncbi:MAG TPA: SelB C-terminal domain-containing protein, partial [Acidobacteriota bacterium]|nr:SelB C-terminal domain-containing protein [Acidobacteriota bacterium]
KAAHTKQPFAHGLNLAEWGIRGRVPADPLPAVAERLIADGIISRTGEAYHLSDHAPQLPAEWQAVEGELWGRLIAGGVQPPTRDELESTSPHARAIVQYWITTARIRPIGDGLIFPVETFAEIRAKVISALKEQPSLTASQLRDLLGTTRKYAVPIGEALDREGVTRREGDVRVLA